MSTELYQVVYNGQTLPGFDDAEVKANLQDLFRATEQRIERLLSPATSSAIKSNLSYNDAQIYQKKLTEAGADVRIEAQTTAPVQTDDLNLTPLEFTGRGGEYFGIWIVNILLTIVTLGIYSAWATVRNNQYFSGNTRLEDSSFQYLASPITILKGRLIALAVLVAYVALSQLYMEAAVLFGVAFIFAAPWIMIRSLRFTAVNSAFRNIRFDFQGKYGEAFMVAFVWPILNLLCLTLLTPLVLKKTHAFIANGSRYGTTPFELTASTGVYYVLFGKALLMIAGFAAAAFLVAQAGLPELAAVIAGVGYLTLFGFFMAGITNLFLSSVQLGDHSFDSQLKPAQMVWIYLSNSLLVVLTLGLFTPWAKVRMARYRASCTSMVISGDLNHFVAAEQTRTSALGQELGDAFDVEFAAI